MVEKEQTLSIQDALGLAAEHYNAGRLPKAEDICRQILHSDPNQHAALRMLGMLEIRAEKYELAIDLIRQAIAIQPNAHLLDCVE